MTGTHTTFRQASALERMGEGRLRAHVPDAWQQGRGAFGGLVLGILARAMEAAETDPSRRLRTLSGDICGPVTPGPADLVVRVLRRGSNQTNVAAELVQDGETRALATSVFSAARPVNVPPMAPTPPADANFQDFDPLPIAPPVGPVFATHYEYRIDGPLPFSGSKESATRGWIAETPRPDALDAPAIIGYLDAFWPAIANLATEPRPAATISFVAELLVDPKTLDPKQPLRQRAQVAAQREGFVVEFRELWSGETLVAMNQQTFVLIK